MKIENRIKAEILADSTNFKGDRAITFLVDIPQIVVKELLRHRMFSFNSSSIRAIPFKKVLDKTKEEMFYPIAFQKEHKGMQGTEYLEGLSAYYQWETTALSACEEAKKLTSIGVTKQLASRVIEPFGYAKILITATEYENYFSLRCPEYFDECDGEYKKSRKEINSANEYGNYPKYFDETLEWLQLSESGAEIHIQDLAEKMWDCRNESESKKLKDSQWHIPFIDNNIKGNKDRLKISVARCARLSFTNHDGNIDHKKDIELFSRLISNKHWGCSEHQLRAMTPEEYVMYSKSYLCKDISHLEKDIALGKTSVEIIFGDLYKVTEYGWCKNIRGFIPYRHLLENNLI